jgi:hypothetical protein
MHQRLVGEPLYCSFARLRISRAFGTYWFKVDAAPSQNLYFLVVAPAVDVSFEFVEGSTASLW